MKHHLMVHHLMVRCSEDCVRLFSPAFRRHLWVARLARQQASAEGPGLPGMCPHPRLTASATRNIALARSVGMTLEVAPVPPATRLDAYPDTSGGSHPTTGASSGHPSL